jgi:starch-binding outer membrane protein, SusD/RagB family
MKRIFKITFMVLATTLFFASCVKDLDTLPIDPRDMTSANVYTTFSGYKQVLAKVYAGLSVSGQQGAAGNPDIAGIDEGFGEYIRGYWYHQELTTDEAVIGWNDQTIKNFHAQAWGSGDVFIAAMYYRIFFQISQCNEFIRESADSKLDSRGFSGADRAEIVRFREEARFMRALSYYHALDMFGNVPFVTENDPVGKFFPTQISRANLYSYVESELLAIEPALAAPRQNEYGRADQAAVWTLLAKLYLNAGVYIGQTKYAECITECNKITGSSYALNPSYKNLFLADNNLNNPEAIFSVNFNGLHTRTWGGTTFIMRAGIGGSMVPADFGVASGWGGTRTTSAIVNKYDLVNDHRALFWTDGQNLEINDIGTFTDGYASTKWKNVTSAGVGGSDKEFPDTDFPMFRLADVYLMYAEAVLRGGGGDAGLALNYVNAIRTRAYGNASGNISSNQLTLDFILDERARELFWEGHRRTDLIRYERFSQSTYLWPWKGGVPNGASTAITYNLFPLPSSDVSANANLTQNPGY